MSNSGSGGTSDHVILKVAVPYATLLRVLRELNHSDPRQAGLAEEIYAAMPEILLARVEAEQITGETLR